MTTEIENGIKLLISMLKADMKPDDACKLTQAALNLAHVVATQANLPQKSA